MRPSIRFAAAAAVMAGLAGLAGGWYGPGHRAASLLAVDILPEEMPAFFRQGGAAIAHSSVDSDLFTRPLARAELHEAEAPEHYFDVELLEGVQPPPGRYQFIELCARKGLRPEKVGLLPYAVTECTGRLAVAFAEHRKWPQDPIIRQKCLHYAGILAHYAQDLNQPLHLTVHYDGRVPRPGDPSPRSGIHARVDDLLAKAAALPVPATSTAPATAPAKALAPFDELFGDVMDQVRRNRQLVEKVYELEKLLPGKDEPLLPGGPVADFALQRLGASAEFTARLFLTAWRDSGKINIPSWHNRQP